MARQQQVATDERIFKVQQENKHLLTRIAKLEKYCVDLLGVPLSRGAREDDDFILSLYERMKATMASRVHSMKTADGLFRFVKQNNLAHQFELLLSEKSEEEKVFWKENFDLFKSMDEEVFNSKMYKVTNLTTLELKCLK